MSRERVGKAPTPEPKRPAAPGSEGTWEAEANRFALGFLAREGGFSLPPPPGSDEPRGVQSLPGGFRGSAEALLGRDFSGVRLRPGARDLGSAHAETSGNEIRLAPGRFRPEHPLGRALLMHELTHVAQQGAAPQRTTRPPGGFGPALELRRASDGRATLEAQRAAVTEPPTPGVTPAPAGTRQRCGGDSTSKSTPGTATTGDAGTGDASAQATTPPPPDPAAEVAKVKSLRIEDNLQPGLAAKSTFTAKRLEARTAAIQKALDTASGAYAEKLRRDLGKSLDQIIKTPDEVANPDLRADIIKAVNDQNAATASLTAENQAFHRFDADFLTADVVTALAGSGFTPADLKALVSQESGDLLPKNEADDEGDIQGVAQIGESAAKAVGADPADRTDPKKAILIAAKYLALNAKNLQKQLSPVPVGEDLKKFVIASYNAGPLTIRTAQEKAVAQKRAGDKWSNIVDPAKGAGIDTSPLHKAWTEMKASVAGLGKIKPDQKYRETKEYVERIYRRLGK